MSILAYTSAFCVKMVALCILRCAEQVYPRLMLCAEHRCAEHVTIKQFYGGTGTRSKIFNELVLNDNRLLTLYMKNVYRMTEHVAPCILRCAEHACQNRLLCAYFAAPSTNVKTGCSVHTSLHRACISKTVAACILRCTEHAYKTVAPCILR